MELLGWHEYIVRIVSRYHEDRDPRDGQTGTEIGNNSRERKIQLPDKPNRHPFLLTITSVAGGQRTRRNHER